MQNTVSGSFHEPKTYDEVIAVNPAYSAEWYARYLPVVTLTLLISGLLLLFSFFFLPWFHMGNDTSFLSLPYYSGVTIASTGARFLIYMFIFPLLWFVVIIAIVQIGIAALLYWYKILTPLLGMAIRICSGILFLVEIIYVFACFFGAFSDLKAKVPSIIGTFPSVGAWIAILITLVAGIVCLVLIPELLWSWELAINDLGHLDKLPPMRRMKKLASQHQVNPQL